jgi:hypothetical protein
MHSLHIRILKERSSETQTTIPGVLDNDHTGRGKRRNASNGDGEDLAYFTLLQEKTVTRNQVYLQSAERSTWSRKRKIKSNLAVLLRDTVVQ